MREYFLEDIMHPKGGIWIKCKNDKDCIFCDHCTDVYWDYTHLIYAISCEEGHDPNDRPCKYFKEEGGENDMGVKEWLELGQNKDGTHNIMCSRCGGKVKSKGHANSIYTRKHFAYCPRCGARIQAYTNTTEFIVGVQSKGE